MIEKIVVPSLGMSFEYVTLTKWVKNEGDYVEKGETIAEATSDKIAMDVTSTIDGYLIKKLYSEDDLVPAKGAIAIVASEKEEKIPEELLNEFETFKGTEQNIEQPSTVISDEASATLKKASTPAAKKMIETYGLDISKIEGKGKGGLITRKDVEEYMRTMEESNRLEVGDDVDDEIELLETVPYIGIRKVIGDNLTKSFHTAVHVTTGLEVDMTEAIKLRKKLMESGRFENLSILALVSRAIVEAIKEYPILNSELKDEKILVKKNINMGIGVASPNGLIVPVIRNMQDMGFGNIARSIQSITEKGRDNAVEMDDLIGGTITLSNAGAFGAITSTPIINYPQCAVLWMGKAVKKPAVVNDEIVIRSIMNLLCSYDHRIVDGSTVAKFLSKIKTMLEFPELLLITD